MLDVVGVIVLTLVLTFFFLPSIIALRRRLPNPESVVALNVLVLTWGFGFLLEAKEPLDKNYPSTPGQQAWRWRAIGGLIGSVASYGLCLFGNHARWCRTARAGQKSSSVSSVS